MFRGSQACIPGGVVADFHDQGEFTDYMTILALLRFALRRLLSRTFLNILILLSVAITVAIMVAVPVFSEGVSRLILREELNVRTQAVNRPPFSVRYYGLPKGRQPLTLEEGRYVHDWLADTLRTEVGLPVVGSYAQYQSPPLRLRLPGKVYTAQEPDLASVRVAIVDGIEEHIEVTHGVPYGQIDDENVLNVWVVRQAADQLALQVGEELDMAYFFRAGAEPIRVKIAGFWEPIDALEPYWYWEPRRLFQDVVVTTPEQYASFIAPITPEGFGFAFWYFILDDSRMSLDQVPQYIQALENIQREVGRRVPDGAMDYAPDQELLRAQSRKTTLSDILLTFALPLMGILASFIASVSFVTARFQIRETAIVRSRGTSRSQLMLLAFLETLIVLAIATPLGVVAGVALARLMGYSFGFLHFTSREPLQVSLIAAEARLIWLALGLGLAARLVPTWLATRFSIVTYERDRARSIGSGGVLRFLLLAFLAAATYYAYYQLVQGGPLGLMGIRSAGESTRDPLLLLAPTLFLFASSLISAELFLILIRPLALVARFLPSTPTYFGWTSLVREGQQYRIPVFLLVLCLNLGIFYASLARSADIWLVDRLRYQVGTDLSFELLPGESGGADSWLVPPSDYEAVPGIERATRVGKFSASMQRTRDLPEVNLLLVDRLDFPDVVYWRPDFASVSLGELMNRLGTTPNGVLIPTSLAAQLPQDLTEEITLDVSISEVIYQFQFRIVGYYDYFPTIGTNGPLYLVGNMDYVQRQIGGSFSHSIWARLSPDANPRTVLEEIEKMQISPARSANLQELIREDQQNLERIGIFGLLTVCFLTGVLLSGAELLIYSFANLTGRTTRFAMLRAIGMHSREIIGIVASEYLLVLAYGVVAGIILGVISSQLYVPYFPLTQNPAQQIPPFLPVVDWGSASWMAASVTVALIVIGGTILIRVVQQQLFQVLRMGNQE